MNGSVFVRIVRSTYSKIVGHGVREDYGLFWGHDDAIIPKLITMLFPKFSLGYPIFASGANGNKVFGHKVS